MAEAAPAAHPIGDDEFAAAWAAAVGPAAIGVVLAVSGGPDSVCMMRMAARLAVRRGLPPLTVATVDHGLREASAAEADTVMQAAAALRLPARRLAWTGRKPARAIQEKAREARYALLTACCHAVGADHLVTAQTRDDQAETVLFRLLRGSGPAGLAGMRARSALGPGLTLARPLLPFDKARLVATCARYGWPFAIDPSNADPRFARPRLRRLRPLLAAEGLDTAALVRLADRAARAEAALEDAADHLARTALRRPAPDRVELDMAGLAPLAAELTVRLLARAVATLGHPRPVRLERLERAAAVLREGALARQTAALTLHGTVLRLSREGLLVVAKEGMRRRGTARAGPLEAAVKHNEGASLGKGGSDPYIAP